MPITVNDGGVLRTLSTVTTNDGGVIREMDSVCTNDGGVLRQILSRGILLSSLNVGNIIKIKENGVPEEYLIVHKGNPDPALYDVSCDGVWVLRKDIYTKRSFGVNNNYAKSYIPSYLDGDIYNLFDENVKKAIKTVKIPYHNGTGSGGSVKSDSNGLSCNVFLLSGYEVGWTISTNQYFPIDGSCLSYFSGTAATDSKRIAYYNGSAAYWWLRSPNTGYTGCVWYVLNNGDYNGDGCTYSCGVRPAFILSDTIRVDSEGNIVA